MATFPLNPQPGSQMGSVPGGGTVSQNQNPLGSNPMMSIAATSPVASTLPGGIQPIFGMVPGGAMPGGSGGGGFNPIGGGGINATTQEGGSKTLAGDLQAIYGQGTGSAVGNVLGGLGTSTSVAEQNMINQTMGAANKGWGNIEAGMGARGVSADSSTAGLAAGDYWSQVMADIAKETGSIGLDEQQTLLQSLTGAGQAHGGDVSGWDTFGNVMQGLGSAAMQVGSMAIPGAGAAAGAGGTIGGSIFKSIIH
jgi:hypothetical protein